MTVRRIALIIGGVASLIAFSGEMLLMIFGNLLHPDQLLFYISVALGPAIVVAVMTGYGVWWLTVFTLTLLGLEDDPRSSE